MGGCGQRPDSIGELLDLAEHLRRRAGEVERHDVEALARMSDRVDTGVVVTTSAANAGCLRVVDHELDRSPQPGGGPGLHPPGTLFLDNAAAGVDSRVAGPFEAVADGAAERVLLSRNPLASFPALLARDMRTFLS